MLPGSPLPSHPREARPSCPCPAPPAAPHFLGSPRRGRPLSLWLHFGVRPRGARSGRRQGVAERSCRHRAGASAPRAGGRARTPVPTPPRGSPRRRASRRHRAGLCSHLAGPGGRGRGRVRRRIAERNRQVGVYFQKTPGWSSGRPASLCRRGSGRGRAHRAGRRRQGQELLSHCSV